MSKGSLMYLISTASLFQCFRATTLKAQSPIETSFDLFSCNMYDFLTILSCVGVAGSEALMLNMMVPVHSNSYMLVDFKFDPKPNRQQVKVM